jgi:chromosomal replication initiation ATPase DnaA
MTQLALAFDHRAALGAENFLIAESNREAVLWLDRWPDWPASALAIYGPAGCGKTHLAHVWQGRSGAQMLTPQALVADTPNEVLGEGGCAVIDWADTSAFDERALFHLYNVAAETGGHLLLTGRAPPARWPVALADLRSRLNAAPAVAVGLPDDALIGALLVKLFGDRQLRVGEDVIAFLLPRMERSFDAARRLVALLDAAALEGRRNITVPLARDIMNRHTNNSEGETPWISD